MSFGKKEWIVPPGETHVINGDCYHGAKEGEEPVTVRLTPNELARCLGHDRLPAVRDLRGFPDCSFEAQLLELLSGGDTDGETPPGTATVTLTPLPEGGVALTVGETTCILPDKAGEFLCDTPSAGIHTFRETNLKTGEVTDTPFSSVNKCARIVGSADILTPVSTNEIRDISFGALTVDLPCRQSIAISTYWDLVVENFSNIVTGGGAGPFATNLYSLVCVDGVRDLATQFRPTLSDAPAFETINDPAQDRLGEYNIAGNTCFELDAGVHTIELKAVIWRASGFQDINFRFTQGSMTAQWSQLECKAAAAAPLRAPAFARSKLGSVYETWGDIARDAKGNAKLPKGDKALEQLEALTALTGDEAFAKHLVGAA